MGSRPDRNLHAGCPFCRGIVDFEYQGFQIQRIGAWFDPLEKRVGEEPLTFRLMAMAAADTGDFERAIKLQKRYIDSGKVTAKDQSVEEALLTIYQQKMKAPKLPDETIEDKALLSDHALETIALQSMVIVKVRGAVACVESETGQTFPRRIERDHIGTVLDTMGTFLVSSETVRLPEFHELLDRKGKGTTQWNSGPFIEVHSLPSNSKPKEAKVSRLLGKAKILGADQATGIAVLELERNSEFHFVGIGTVESSPRFEPEFRSYSSESESKLTENLEVSVNKGDAFQRAELQKYPTAGLKTRVYEDPSMPYPMTAMLYMLPESQASIGTPIFNRLGECIGIRHRVVHVKKEVSVAVPAFVCTRVAAKLAAHGQVDRMNCPFEIFPVKQIVKTNTVKSGNLWGIMAFQEPALAGYEGLDRKIIVSVDGMQTPTLTQWLAAIERVSSLGLESVAIEVFDEKSGLGTVMSVPTQKPPTPTPIAPSARNEPNVVESTSTIDSRAAIEKASQWVANNVDIDREVLDDLIQKFDRMMQNKQNIACYFGSGVVKNGKFHTLLIRDGEVMVIPLSPRSAKLLLLNPNKGAIMQFGEANAKQASAAELSNLKLGFKNVDGKEPFLTINADFRMIRGYAKNISLRIQFVAAQKTPIVVPIEKTPVQDNKKPISLSVPTSAANRSGPIGGLVVIDLVSKEGSVDSPKYRSVSNQVVEYAELIAPEIADMFVMMNEAAQDEEPRP